MQDTPRIVVLSRRSFVIAASAALTLPSRFALAQGTTATGLERSTLFQSDFKALVGGATPVEGKITLELPEIAENGNFVPVTITVDSPMTADDYVNTITLLSTSNPVARVATFHLSPANAVARVQSRMRLSRTQDVVVLAAMSDGTLAIATAIVKVTIGGCSG